MEENNHLSRPWYGSDNSELSKKKKVLFQKCILMVDAYVNSHIHNEDDAHNLRQEILLKALEAFDKSYHEEGRFRAWVLTIAMNMVRDYYRRKQRAPRVILLNDESFSAMRLVNRGRPLKFFIMYERFCCSLGELMLELTPFERVLIWDLFFHEMSFRQAGKERNISKSACFKRCKRILAKIRKRLRNKGIDIDFLKGNL